MIIVSSFITAGYITKIKIKFMKSSLKTFQLWMHLDWRKPFITLSKISDKNLLISHFWFSPSLCLWNHSRLKLCIKEPVIWITCFCQKMRSLGLVINQSTKKKWRKRQNAKLYVPSDLISQKVNYSYNLKNA